MFSGKVSLRTPFVIQNFAGIDNFIISIFPDLESFLKDQIEVGIQKSALVNIAYSKLKDSFKFFIVRNYSKEIEDYLRQETDHLNKEAMKEVVLSTISITLNVTDNNSNKLTDRDYLDALRDIIDRIA